MTPRATSPHEMLRASSHETHRGQRVTIDVLTFEVYVLYPVLLLLLPLIPLFIGALDLRSSDELHPPPPEGRT